jgi:hypothetical protein
VVVADRAAGREGVAEPEAVLLRDPFAMSENVAGALVGGDDEVRVVAVVAHDERAARHLPVADGVVRSSRPLMNVR